MGKYSRGWPVREVLVDIALGELENDEVTGPHFNEHLSFPTFGKGRGMRHPSRDYCTAKYQCTVRAKICPCRWLYLSSAEEKQEKTVLGLERKYLTVSKERAEKSSGGRIVSQVFPRGLEYISNNTQLSSKWALLFSCCRPVNGEMQGGNRQSTNIPPHSRTSSWQKIYSFFSSWNQKMSQDRHFC